MCNSVYPYTVEFITLLMYIACCSISLLSCIFQPNVQYCWLSIELCLHILSRRLWTRQLKRRVNVHFTKMKIKNINVDSGSKQATAYSFSLNIHYCWHIERVKWKEKFVMRACSSLIEVLFYWDWLEASLWMI